MCSNWPRHHLPNLAPGNYLPTSPCTRTYNCIAWAAGETHVWWEPDQLNIYYWPPGVPRAYTVDAYLRAFETRGYAACVDSALEAGVEKIAVFATVTAVGPWPTHAARQLENGHWTSKLGPCEDIQHFALASVNGPVYGAPVAFMGRPRPQP